MVKVYKCERCKHEWAGRLSRPPKVCPRCNSPYWNKSRRKGEETNVQEEASTDDRVTYNYLKSSWSSWKDAAERLVRVAYKLESERSTGDKRFIAHGYDDVYYMLIGFALENYLKGAIVQSLLMSGKSLEEDKLDVFLSNHDIRELFSKAGLKVKNKLYHSYLDYLTECVVWRGRYSLPTKAEDIGGSITYHPPKKDDKYIVVTGMTHAIPVDVIHEFVDMAKTNLEDIKQKVKVKKL